MSTLNDTSIPFTVSLLEHMDAVVTPEEIAQGYHTRNAITLEDTLEETVASYGKKAVLFKPDWLFHICKKVGGKNTNDDRNITVRFGNGQDIIAKMRSNETRNKKVSKEDKATLAIRVFLVENEVPAMLDPKDNLYNHLHASLSRMKRIQEVRICPCKVWDAISNQDSENTVTDVIFITKNNSLQEVILGDIVQTIISSTEEDKEIRK
mmetsp:Transcript_8634/g.9958  ORF Transcript_8634/g.9958 Transcript_8634/m.9958 type:complete len:208 (+) Transcript_8634:125-748(+)